MTETQVTEEAGPVPGHFLQFPDRLTHLGAAILATVSSLWIFTITGLVCFDILMRSVLNRPVQGVPEMVAHSVPGCVFLAAAYAVRSGRFLRADFVFSAILKVYPRAGACLDGLFNLAGAWVLYKIASGTWPRLVSAWETSEFFGAIGVFTAPVWPFTATIVIGSTLAALQFLLLAISALLRLRRTSAEPWPSFLLAGGFVAAAAAGGVVMIQGGLSPIEVGFLAIAGMLLLVLMGVHIATGLVVLSFLGIWAVRGNIGIADRSLVLAATGSISSYSFGVIPLFILMGLFVDIANVGRDAFGVAASLVKRLKGGLGIATVVANAVFAAITGSSIASAAVFTRVATPQMIRHGYTTRFSVGVVAGSSVLGMLIPPSLLLIVYGLIAEVSVGKLFLAAVIPGLLLMLAYSVMIAGLAHAAPGFVGNVRPADSVEPVSLRELATKLLPILLLIAVVLGGIYAGYFTPTESGAVGAAGGFLIALSRRALDWQKFRRILLETAEISASVLFLIVAANLYSRMLTLTNIPQGIAEWMVAADLGMAAFLAIYLVILILLGMFLDSVSIMLILLPLMLPVVVSLGGDLVWFGVVTTIAVEIGLLTPPFGLSVYVVKGTLPPGTASLNDIFAGAFPFVLTMILVTVIVMAFPWLSLALL